MSSSEAAGFLLYSSFVSPQAHLVAAFEQSLGNMTIRLKSLTLTAEQKVTAAPRVSQQVECEL